MEGNAFFLEDFAQALGYVAVEGGQTFLEILDDGDLRAEAVEHAGELHADDTSTNDAEALGKGFEIQESRGIDHSRIILDALDGEPFGL